MSSQAKDLEEMAAVQNPRPLVSDGPVDCDNCQNHVAAVESELHFGASDDETQRLS